MVSIVIRTLNEQRYLPELLEAIKGQKLPGMQFETVLVDSGSTDDTLKIAKRYNCRITHIKKEDFTFGRSLNVGCDYARGEYLVFISGHCIPTDSSWLANLVKPLKQKDIAYSYGKQVARDTTKFSEVQIFNKFYPAESKIPQEDYFCNNANASIARSKSGERPFDEELTGLEDMYLAKRLVGEGYKVAYTSNSTVFHIHDESWKQVKTRYEREAVALQVIKPNIQFNKADFIRYTYRSILLDFKEAFKTKQLFGNIYSIIMFRTMQYWGTYKGNSQVRNVSEKMKMEYFYPTERIK